MFKTDYMPSEATSISQNTVIICEIYQEVLFVFNSGHVCRFLHLDAWMLRLADSILIPINVADEGLSI